MLAPVSEVTYTEEPLLRLGLASLARWPSFRGRARRTASGHDLDYRTDGTLDVAFGADDLAALDELAAFIEKLGPAGRAADRARMPPAGAHAGPVRPRRPAGR